MIIERDVEHSLQRMYEKGYKQGHEDALKKTKEKILEFLKCPEYENCDWKNCFDCNKSRCIDLNNVNHLMPIIEADKKEEV